MTEQRDRTAIAKWIIGAVGMLLVVFGLWAYASPKSFFDSIATYPPYNEHLIHDIGAFQVGIGLSALLSLVWRDGLFIALGGVGVGSSLHALAHAVDFDLGGRTTDPLVLIILTSAVAVAMVLRYRVVGRRP